MDKPTPRVNASALSRFVNKTVRLTGHVVQSQGTSFILETSDGSTVSVKPLPECTFTAKNIEVVGKVQADGTVTGFSAVDLSDNFDLKTYGMFENASQKYPELFGQEI